MILEDKPLKDTGALPRVPTHSATLPRADKFIQDVEEKLLDDLYTDIDRINEQI